eukprot:1188825-Ditylum_brightwellii.AAC.1
MKQNRTYGHLLEAKDENMLQIWLQNIKGFKNSSDQTHVITLFETLNQNGVNIALLPESDTPCTQDRFKKYRSIGHKIYGHFKLEGASSDDTCIGNYQPGGVAVLVGKDAVGRISDSGVDKRELGRWAYFCLNGQYNNKYG